jgi:hypothetical protein
VSSRSSLGLGIRRRIVAGFVVSAIVFAASIAFLHHHHDLQSSSPCQICYALHLPAFSAKVSVSISQLLVFAFASPVVAHIVSAEPVIKDYPPRAPPN